MMIGGYVAFRVEREATAVPVLHQQQNDGRRHALAHSGIVQRGCGGCGVVEAAV